MPPVLYLEQSLSIQLHALARNRNGDSVTAEVVWRTPDTTVTLDGATGLVTARFATGAARIQAAVFGKDTLVSDYEKLKFTLTGRADSLRLVGSDSLTVTQDSEASPAIDLRLVQLPAGQGVPGRPIRFEIVEPVPETPPTVRLSTAKVRDSLLSGATGGPNVPVTVRAAPGAVPPDRVVVEVTALRASGEAIPGSGRRIVIRFLHQ